MSFLRHLAPPALLALALPGAAALAHHGWSSYDATKVLTIKGPIVESPVSRMENRALPREDLAVGKVVTVVGYPSRVQANEMRAERITTQDGKTVELR
jgi:hypothetical protein